jgi:hypothetical protein
MTPGHIPDERSYYENEGRNVRTLEGEPLAFLPFGFIPKLIHLFQLHIR